MARKPPVVLIIAGNDPSGGAGICADTQTVSRLGCHPAPVLSSLTVQDTRNAYAVRALDPDFVVAQARTVLEDMPVRAIKLGLLGSAAVARAVGELLASRPEIPTVIDPVLVAAGGAALAEEEVTSVYLTDLLPRATIATPNALESRRLAPEAPTAGARATRLLALGCRYVLLKGADEDTPDVVNTLYSHDGQVIVHRWERLEGHYHGSGCTLASAIAARLAHGDAPVAAVAAAQAYTWNALRNGWKLGRGQRIPNRHCPH
ncbi:MAG TPA: hydroxymethylpyrimidine/phosphomethylpyrimidine kinase [Gammaproteobacteria bacterium]|nr:hydroxymethylpyrimidine/phosphomethylpyrimidine kinase [Gammaproteobacteria bacterium]